jgi:hexosaminidase
LFPALSAKGAFSANAIYSLDDLSAIVAYGRSRAVRIVPEIEMPGHGSFYAGMPQLSLSSCSDVLDPTKNSTYTFLSQFLNEMGTVFTDELLYLGGDEVGFDPKCKWPGASKCGYHCFDKDPSVAAWMKEKGINATQTLGK